jgi:hypothetical protein
MKESAMQTLNASQPCDNNRAPHPALRKTRTLQRRTAARPRGFALIVTVSLMVLLAIMTVGLLSLSTISLRGAAQGMAQADAQANARLALMIAIAELQKEMGPDQRISAPGGQLLEESDKSARNHWTGVYESWPVGSEIRPSPVFRRWLISGNDSVTSSRQAVASGESLAIPDANLDSGIVTLVPGDLDNDPVEAGLVPTENGSYAWWVADENTKAKLGGRVEKPALVDQNIARMQAAPRANHEVFFTGNTPAPDAPELDRIVSAKTVSLLGDTDRTYFHDMTANATGLVTNVRTGGFRKDLNFFLEKRLADLTAVDKGPLYTAGSMSGINFYELWRDFNVWGELVYPSNPPNHQDGSSMTSGVPTMVRLAKVSDAASDPFLYYRSVCKLQTTLVYSLKAEKEGTDKEPKYRLYLIVDPLFTIWNPLNVPIHIPTSVYTTFKTWSVPYDLVLNIKGGANANSIISKSIQQIVRESSGRDANFMNAYIGRTKPITMRPGEVQIQAQGFNQPVITANQIKFHDNTLGWDGGSGYKFEIKVDGNPSNSALQDGNGQINYSLLRNGDTNMQFGLYLSGHSIGPVDTPGEWRHIGGHGINFRGGTSTPAIKATSHPNIFPNIPNNASAMKSVADLVKEKWPIFLVSFGMRTEYDPDFDAILPPEVKGTRSTARFLQRFNPKSLSFDMFDLKDDIVRASPLQIGVRRLNSLSDVAIQCDGQGFGYFGGSYRSNEGVSYLVTHHVPTRPIHSLGALQHSLADGSQVGVASENSARSRLLPSLSHPISNSFAPSVMAPDKIRTTLGGRDAADHSYLANLALWDDWFFSSISPETVTVHKNRVTALREQKSRLEDFLSGKIELPNPRFIPVAGDPMEAVSKVFSGSRPATDAHWRTAALLLVDGAFNVNSVSVPAWKAFLSGLKGEDVPVRATSSTPELVSTTDTPVPGLILPIVPHDPDGKKKPKDSLIPEDSLNDSRNPEQWTGFRALTDYQIEELATAIVKQVRLRGPFTSLADFVNRRPGSDKNLALSGAIQSALDDPDVSINEAYRSGSRALPAGSASGFPFPEAEAGPKAVGAPGYVKQGDILTAIAPLITVRGDTFLIRAYGDARDKSGNIIARAWCEAVVRRMPEYVDPADPAVPDKFPTNWSNPYPSPKVAANQIFGRRMEIVSIRWLAPEEA